jgi:hypothetical protein
LLQLDIGADWKCARNRRHRQSRNAAAEDTSEEYNKKWCEAHELACERVGVDDPSKMTSEQAKALHAASMTTWDEVGAEEAHAALELLDDRADDLTIKILEAPVHTLAGLRAKVAVAVDTNPRLWWKPVEDLDCDQKAQRMLIEAVCSLTGFEVPENAWGDGETPSIPETDNEASNADDPIFAAIERWKKLDALHVAAIDATDDADRRAVSDEMYEATVMPAYRAQRAAQTAAYDATMAVFQIVPTTLAGMRAKIDFAFSVDHVTNSLMRNSAHKDEMVRSFADSLYEAARLMAVRS